MKTGDLGVSFFFVLSGFLITYLLFKELETQHKINIGQFYLRRVLRIWPLYFIIVFLGFYVIPSLDFVSAQQSLFPFPINADGSRLTWYLSFLSNFDIITNHGISIVVVCLWSVSVEEQFYLLCPLLLYFVRSKQILTIFYSIIFISFMYRFFNWNDPELLHFSTFSVVSDLCVGALIAYYTLFSPAFKQKFMSIKKWQIVAIYITGFTMIFLRGFSHIFGEIIYRFYIPFESLLFTSFFAFILLEQNFSDNSFFKMGRSRVLTYLGKISYGLYCFHTVVILLCLSMFLHFGLSLNNTTNYVLLIFISFMITVLISVISYSILEKRLINFKDKYLHSTHVELKTTNEKNTITRGHRLYGQKR